MVMMLVAMVAMVMGMEKEEEGMGREGEVEEEEQAVLWKDLTASAITVSVKKDTWIVAPKKEDMGMRRGELWSHTDLSIFTPVLSGMGRAIATGPWRVNIATVTIVSASMDMDYRGMEGAVGGIENHNHYVRECIIFSK